MTDAVTGQSPNALNGGLTLLVVALVISMSAGWLAYSLNWGLQERTNLMIETELAFLVSEIPTLEHHERPEYLKEMDLLRQNISSLTSLPDVIIGRVGSVGSIVITLVLLAGVHPALLFLPLFGIPSLRIAISTARRTRKKNEEIAEPRRLGGYLYYATTLPAMGKEVRVFGLADELVTRFLRTNEDFDRAEERTQVTNALWTALGWSTFAVGFIAAIGFVSARVLSGASNLGELVLAVSLASQVNVQVSALAGGLSTFTTALDAARRWGWLRDHSTQVLERLAGRDGTTAPGQLRKGIELRDISFTYPGTEKVVLENVNATFPAGSTIAIVGDNGAGKTTIVKLLSRFYEPTSGEVFVDDVPLSDIQVGSWRSKLSAAFQDFAHFEFSAREVVGIGNLAQIEDVVAVEAALERAHASDVAPGLPQGLSTQLGRSFDGGVELSTGQWQKLAVGRAMMRETPILLLLDEPTASLDAVTEHALFQRYTDAARRSADESGAITILVSHRFSTVRMADLILVIDKGHVVEQGSHHELMELDGVYAELYRMQSKAYVE
ncbi:MAG: ABC transporter ATP-binding protein/permease [Actinobacteria bacterium]|nr:ABC transporter ATP-binding protein/permease [Actinomycetota bacterium]